MVNTVVVWLHILGSYWCMYVGQNIARSVYQNKEISNLTTGDSVSTTISTVVLWVFQENYMAVINVE